MKLSEESTCCFTGHRMLPQKKVEQILKQLNKAVDKLIR